MENRAKWHKSCYLKFNLTKLQCAQPFLTIVCKNHIRKWTTCSIEIIVVIISVIIEAYYLWGGNWRERGDSSPVDETLIIINTDKSCKHPLHTLYAI